MIATERAVFTATRDAVVHFHPLRLLGRPPLAGGFAKRRCAREGGLLRSLRCGRPARATAILVAPFGRAPSERPPVIGPKHRSARVAAPRSPARRQYGT